MFTALYLPSRTDGEPDPSKDGFPTHEAARDFIDSQMCKSCKEELELWKKGDSENGSSCPPCRCEWVVVPTDKLAECDDLEDIFEAAGFERVDTDQTEE